MAHVELGKKDVGADGFISAERKGQGAGATRQKRECRRIGETAGYACGRRRRLKVWEREARGMEAIALLFVLWVGGERRKSLPAGQKA